MTTYKTKIQRVILCRICKKRVKQNSKTGKSKTLCSPDCVKVHNKIYMREAQRAWRAKNAPNVGSEASISRFKQGFIPHIRDEPLTSKLGQMLKNRVPSISGKGCSEK